jgi:ferredoxin
MNVTTHPDRCIASGQCVVTAAAVFDQDEAEGTVVLLEPDPSADHEEDVRRAARLCPSAAIEIQEQPRR